MQGLWHCGVMVLALLVASGLSQAQQPKRSMVKIKAAQAFTGDVAQNAAVHAAIRAGFFKEEGLEVEVVNFRSWTEPVQALASDSAQFALGAASLVRAAATTSAPVRQIAMLSSIYPYEFHVRRDSGIKSVADLRGKTITTVRPGETLDVVWTQILEGAGLKMSDVKRTESFNGLGTLVSGSADAANIIDTLLPKARAAGLVKLVDYTEWRQQKGMISGNGANLGWGTTVKMLKEHPDVVRAYLRALVKATLRLKNDRAFAVDLLQRVPFSLDGETAAEIADRNRPHWIIRLDYSKGDLSFDAEMVEIALGRQKGSIDLRTVSDAAPVNEVLKEMKVTF